MTIQEAGPKTVRDFLRQACARNMSADLEFDTDKGQFTARLRLLSVDGEELFTDQPQSVGVSASLRVRQPVAIYLQMDGVRYAFQTRVLRPRTLVSLNAERRP